MLGDPPPACSRPLPMRCTLQEYVYNLVGKGRSEFRLERRTGFSYCCCVIRELCCQSGGERRGEAVAASWTYVGLLEAARVGRTGWEREGVGFWKSSGVVATPLSSSATGGSCRC